MYKKYNMDDFDKKILEIKKNRQPEYWLDFIFSNLKEYKIKRKYITNNINVLYKIHCNKDVIYYKYKNILLFKYDKYNHSFFVSPSIIIYILKNKFKCNDEQIANLIAEKAKKYLNIDEIESYYDTIDFLPLEKKILKFKKITIPNLLINLRKFIKSQIFYIDYDLLESQDINKYLKKWIY